jgi:hypothetical protein
MVTEEATPLQVERAAIGTLELGEIELPYVDLNEAPAIRTKLVLGEHEYEYVRSFPIKGHSAIMPDAVAELRGQGKRLLVAERNDRYYLYAA